MDHIDNINRVNPLPLLTNQDSATSQEKPPEPEEQTEDTQMKEKVNLYRKRLNRWKNLGVWLVFISVGAAILSVGVIRYNLLVKDVSREAGLLRKWIILGLFFGGVNIICQLSACWIMMSATYTMKKLTAKNGFDSQKFHDIRMNNVVSMLICIGYCIDYAFDIVLTIMMLKDMLDAGQEDFWAFVNHIILSCCIFTAYIILLKIFLTYQRQLHETSKKQKEKKLKQKEKALKEEAKKQQQQLLNGETGVTPNNLEAEELHQVGAANSQLSKALAGYKVAVNDEEGDDAEADNAD